MRIKGFEPFSASDWPGRLAAVIFCGGCNLACGYCHNSRLIHDAAPWLDEEEVFAELEQIAATGKTGETYRYLEVRE